MTKKGFKTIVPVLMVLVLSGCNLGITGSVSLLIPLTTPDSRNIGPAYDWSEFMPTFSELELTISQQGDEVFRQTYINPPPLIEIRLAHTGNFAIQLRAVPDWAATSTRVGAELAPSLPVLAREYRAAGTVSNLGNNQTATVQLRLQVSRTVVLGPNTSATPARLRWAETISAINPQLFLMDENTFLNSGAYFRFDRFGRLHTALVINDGNLANFGAAWANPAYQTPTTLLEWNTNAISPAFDQLNNANYYYFFGNPGNLLRVVNDIVQQVSIASADYSFLSWIYDQRGLIIADSVGNLYLTLRHNEDFVLARATIDTSGANPQLVVNSFKTLSELGMEEFFYIQDMLMQNGYLYIAVAKKNGSEILEGYFLKIRPDNLTPLMLPTPTEALVPRRFLALQHGKLVFLDAPQDGSTMTTESVRSYDLTTGTVEIGYSTTSSTTDDFVNMYYC